MSRARVYLFEPPSNKPRDLGVIEIDPSPEKRLVVNFQDGGTTVYGEVDIVDPADWKQCGVTPSVHIIRK